MSEELKPCPFCGGEAWLRSPSLPMAADCDDVQVSCSNCDTSGPPILFDQDVHGETDLPDLEAQAIAAWNTRPAANVEAEPVAWLHEHEAGERVLSWHRLTEADKKYGWTETPLCPASALKQVRKDALEAALQAIENERSANAADFDRQGVIWAAFDNAILACHKAVSNLKDQANG